MVCPHCAAAPLSCHACHDTGRLHWLDLERAMHNVWALTGCNCEACAAVGPVPGMEC